MLCLVGLNYYPKLLFIFRCLAMQSPTEQHAHFGN